MVETIIVRAEKTELQANTKAFEKKKQTTIKYMFFMKCKEPQVCQSQSELESKVDSNVKFKVNELYIYKFTSK